MSKQLISKWVRVSMLALPLAGFAVLPGCGGSNVKEETIQGENPPEIQDANKAMEDYMKSGGGAAPSNP